MKINFTRTNNKISHVASGFFLVAVLLALCTRVQAQTITTIAGNGNQGEGGNGLAATDAELYLPLGVAVDDSGNVYIADEFNDRIREVYAKTGIINVIAGGGSNPGNDGLGDGGPATGSSMYSPTCVAVDDSGNVYCVDDNYVRKITKATGIINAIAGNGKWLYSGDGGPATAAELRALTVAVDDSGNVFIADFQNNRVREVRAATGIINTVAGTGYNAPHEGGYTGDGGPATAAELDYPSGIALDDSDNIYIADDYNQVIRKVSAATGIINTIVGNGYGQGTSGVGGYTGDGGPATAAELSDPCFIVLDDSNNIYIADRFNEVLRKVSARTGIINTFAGVDTVGGYSGDNGPATLAELNEPGGLAQQCGNIFIADWGNSRIRKVTVTGPSPTNNIIASSTTICPGKAVTFRDSTNFGATNFTWSFFSGTPDTSTSPNPVITYAKAGTYYLSVNAWNSCYSVYNTFVNFIKVTDAPLTIVPSSASVCPGQSVALEVSGGGSGFEWSPATGLNETTGDSVVAAPSATVTYTVTGTDSTGCGAIGSAVVTLGISPNKPSFHQHGDTLISSSAHDNQWYRNDTLLIDDTSQYLIITVLGEYWVAVLNEVNGCSTASDSMNISTVTGVNQLSVESGQLTVYPNPFTSTVFIKINSSAADLSNWNLMVTDVLGRTLFTMSPLNHLKGTFAIDLSNFSSGVYFITVVTKAGRAVYPVMKQ